MVWLPLSLLEANQRRAMYIYVTASVSIAKLRSCDLIGGTFVMYCGRIWSLVTEPSEPRDETRGRKKCVVNGRSVSQESEQARFPLKQTNKQTNKQANKQTVNTLVHEMMLSCVRNHEQCQQMLYGLYTLLSQLKMFPWEIRVAVPRGKLAATESCHPA